MSAETTTHPSPQPPAINPQNPLLSPYFRVMRVMRTETLSPLMRRIVLGDAPLDGFDFEAPPGCLAPHVHLEIPPDGAARPDWPQLRGDGTLRVGKPTGPGAPTERTYSMRSIDVAKGEIAVDFVLHGAGPGAGFGARARPGDPCGVWWPHGTLLPATEWFLIGGDQTALPGIAWILERLPPDATGHAVIEIADAAEEQPLARPAGLSLTWLHLDGTPPGLSGRLRDAVLSTPWPQDALPFLWFGAEATAARAVRRHARNVLRLDRKRFEIINYWKRGSKEGEFDSSR